MNNVKKTYRFILSGGGTGGHLFPAIAIANELKKQFPESEFLFVGAKGKMEMEKVPKAGYKIEGLWIGGFQRQNMLKNLSLPFKIISSLNKSGRLLRKFKPDVVIGTGGYASFPLIYKAAKKGIPSLIQEQNFFPGVTNKYLSKYVNSVCTVYEGMEKYFAKEKIKITGNPIRKELLTKVDKKEAFAKFGLQEDKKTLLVIGGSLGARTLNLAMKKSLQNLLNSDIQIIWQTGKFYIEELKKEVSTHPNLWMDAFIDDMPSAYAAADLVVSRAGAISISELAALGKACVLIPSPNVAEDHQTKNAMSLVKEKAAELIPDKDAVSMLENQVLVLLSEELKLNELSKNILAFAKPNATELIVEEIKQLIK
jgi:UDP-N-acetylglucosamine--N-acetylmuramyl-(pentapeptide) pyrophosphoryl-undecaprenol N-acetylglucosamine transferase